MLDLTSYFFLSYMIQGYRSSWFQITVLDRGLLSIFRVIFHSSITFGSNRIIASHKKLYFHLFTCYFFRGIYAQIMCSELIYGSCKTGPLSPRNRFSALKWAGRPSPKPVWPSQPFGLGSGGTRLLRGVGSNSKKTQADFFMNWLREVSEFHFLLFQK